MAQLKHPKMVDIRDILDENTRLPALVAASAEKLLGLERLNKAYDKIVRDKESGSQENFFQLAEIEISRLFVISFQRRITYQKYLLSR